MKVLELIVHYMDKKTEQRKTITVKPSSQVPVIMKIDVAKAIGKVLPRMQYYYVVAVVKKSDGSKGYRTIVPKTVIAA